MTRAMDADADSDSVFLEGMQFYGYHGVNPAEQVLGQRFLVDVELRTDVRAAGLADDLAATINYSAVYTCVREILEGPPRRLIEAVAETIAQALLSEFGPSQVVVTVRKPDVPLRGAMLAAAGVRIVRRRANAQSKRGD